MSKNYQHRDSIRGKLVEFGDEWANNDSPQLLENMVDYCMSLVPYPVRESQVGQSPEGQDELWDEVAKRIADSKYYDYRGNFKGYDFLTQLKQSFTINRNP